MHTEQTDDEIQAELAGESVRGPRVFRGRKLAPLTGGLRDLRNKVVFQEDTATFHDFALLHILAQACSETDAVKVETRRRLIAATDDVPTFRAEISLLMDDDTDAKEARRIVNEILGLVEKAEVSLAEKKSAVAAPVEPSLTVTPSTSGESPESQDGAPTTSAGNSH